MRRANITLNLAMLACGGIACSEHGGDGADIDVSQARMEAVAAELCRARECTPGAVEQEEAACRRDQLEIFQHEFSSSTDACIDSALDIYECYLSSWCDGGASDDCDPNPPEEGCAESLVPPG